MQIRYNIIDRTTNEVIGYALTLSGARRVSRSGDFGLNLGYRKVSL